MPARATPPSDPVAPSAIARAYAAHRSRGKGVLVRALRGEISELRPFTRTLISPARWACYEKLMSVALIRRALARDRESLEVGGEGLS